MLSLTHRGKLTLLRLIAVTARYAPRWKRLEVLPLQFPCEGTCQDLPKGLTFRSLVVGGVVHIVE